MERDLPMGRVRRYLAPRCIAGALTLLTVMLMAVTAAAPAESFDAPLHQRVVNLGHSRYHNGQIKLTCAYFGSFMVKELDLGDEGANWFAIVHTRPGQIPVCTRVHGANEKVIEGHDWCGYFQGAKDDFVFLNACDAYNGGLDFAVYDARTGTRIFQDTAVDSSAGGLQFSRAPGGKISLHYSRIVVFGCTLPRDQAGCWSEIRNKLGLEDAAVPVCTTYEKQMTGSVIAYPVEVGLSDKPEVRAVAGQIRCWPPE